jgi:hypothetical protein
MRFIPLYPVDIEAFHGVMVMAYVTSVLAVMYCVFGFVRTAATRLPIPRGRVIDPDLFILDMTPKLYSFDSRRRKVLKLVIFSVAGLFFILEWLTVMYFTYRASDVWFGWGLSDDQTILIAHMVLLAVLATPFAIRAYSHANRFPELERTVIESA